MAVAFVRAHVASIFIKSAGTTDNALTDAVVAADNLIVIAFVFDNAATASKPVISGLGKQSGETNNWVFLGAARSTSTSSGAFSSVTTTKLLTVEEMLTALGGSAATAAYRAPGEPA